MATGVSIIIPTLNGGKIFSQCLDAIAGQAYDETIQLLVVDSGSKDSTIAQAKNAGAVVKLVSSKTFHHARTRNQAISHAVFDRVIFMVQDAIPCSDQWLKGMIRALDDPGIVAAFAAQVPHKNATPYARFETESIAQARLNMPSLGGIESIESFLAMPYDDAYRRVGLDNVCAIYRKEALEKTPFPDVEFAEDLAWALKVSLRGHRILYLPDVQVWHSHNRSPDYGFRRQIVNSYWLLRIMRRVREDFSFLSLWDLACLTRSARVLILEKSSKRQKKTVEDHSENLFLDQLRKQYPFRVRMGIGFFDSLHKFGTFMVGNKGRMNERMKWDILNRLKTIEDLYPPKDRKEWFATLEQVVANILGRMHGEVYAGRTLKGSVSRQLKKFMEPFLSGV